MVRNRQSMELAYLPGGTHLQIGFVANHRTLYVSLHNPRQNGSNLASLLNSAKAAEFSKWAILVTSLSSLTMPNGNWSGNLAQNFFNVFFRRHRPRQNGSTNLEENYCHLPKIR